jgi:hypothetical protein
MCHPHHFFEEKRKKVRVMLWGVTPMKPSIKGLHIFKYTHFSSQSLYSVFSQETIYLGVYKWTVINRLKIDIHTYLLL